MKYDAELNMDVLVLCSFCESHGPSVGNIILINFITFNIFIIIS